MRGIFADRERGGGGEMGTVCALKYFSFRTNVYFSSFKIIQLRLFLFQKHIYIHKCKTKLAYNHYVANSKALADAIEKRKKKMKFKKKHILIFQHKK